MQALLLVGLNELMNDPMDLHDFLPLAEYARQRELKLSTLAARIQRGHIPADCIQRIGRTVLIKNQDYDPPTGNLKGAPRSGGGRPPKPKPEPESEPEKEAAPEN